MKFAFRTGTKANLPALDAGEPGFCTDTGNLFVGNGVSNIQINYGVGYLRDCTDVNITNPQEDDILVWNGTQFVNQPDFWKDNMHNGFVGVGLTKVLMFEALEIDGGICIGSIKSGGTHLAGTMYFNRSAFIGYTLTDHYAPRWVRLAILSLEHLYDFEHLGTPSTSFTFWFQDRVNGWACRSWPKTLPETAEQGETVQFTNGEWKAVGLKELVAERVKAMITRKGE